MVPNRNNPNLCGRLVSPTLAMALDLALSTQPVDNPGAFVGASIDFKAARKQVQVRPEEHGLLLFISRKALPLQSVPFGGPFLGILVAAHWRILALPGAWIAGLAKTTW